jgi:hypothetical protein
MNYGESNGNSNASFAVSNYGKGFEKMSEHFQ